MRVQVTKSQFIETDDIQFAESALWSEDETLVYLRHRREPIQVETDYASFVARLNEANRGIVSQSVITT